MRCNSKLRRRKKTIRKEKVKRLKEEKKIPKNKEYGNNINGGGILYVDKRIFRIRYSVAKNIPSISSFGRWIGNFFLFFAFSIFFLVLFFL